MSRIGQIIGGGGAAAAAFFLLVGSPSMDPSFGWSLGNPNDSSYTTAPSDDESDESSDDADDASGSCDKSISVAGRTVADYLYAQGFAKRDFIVGARVIDWAFNTGHEEYAFSEPLTSEQQVVDFLASETKRGRAAYDIAGSADDYVAVQFINPIRYTDNWYWKAGKAVQGGDRMVLAGDVWWMALDDDCEVSEASSIRANCGNPGVFWLRPAVDPRR